MSIEIRMPALSANMEVGSVARWLAREGAEVKRGDVIAEIETDKAVMELQAEQDGVLVKLLTPEGSAAIKVGDAIALLTPKGKRVESATSQSPVSVTRDDTGAPAADTARLVKEHQSGSANRRRIKASPIARRLARELGLDLSRLQGSGPGARIVKSDVERLAGSGALRGSQSPSLGTLAPHELLPLSMMRRAIARRLSESKATVPHFYLTVDIRVDALLTLRAELNKLGETKISVNDMLIKAMAVALHRVPVANVQFAGEHLFRFKRSDLAVAVAIPGGLVTPVVRDCTSKSLGVIAAEMKELSNRARSGKLTPDEYQGGTASLSNLGMYGIKQFEAIINPPEALIVAVGAGERRAVVDGASDIKPATVMTATGSFDHRAIDGAVGAQFMKAVQEIVETPLALLL